MGVSPSSPATRRVETAPIPSERRIRSATAMTRSRGWTFLFTVYTPAMYTLYITGAAVLLAAPLSGTWKVSLHEQDGVELEFRMTIEQPGGDRARWEAWSRPDAAREIVG